LRRWFILVFPNAKSTMAGESFVGSFFFGGGNPGKWKAGVHGLLILLAVKGTQPKSGHCERYRKWVWIKTTYYARFRKIVVSIPT
jgi:hypothetical protein